MEELPSHQPFDIVVECSGAPEGFEAALRSVRPRGTIVQKSTYAGLLELDISSLVVDEVRIVGSRCGPFAPALRALASGAVAVRSLIERVLPFDDAVDAFAMARDALGKIILKM
jgi:threonine dehydrogenase-like Zn-dependent dehydrogenase